MFLISSSKFFISSFASPEMEFFQLILDSRYFFANSLRSSLSKNRYRKIRVSNFNLRLSFLARFFISSAIFWNYIWRINPLSSKPTKWSNTLKQFVGNLLTNCLSVFDHFVGLALKGLKRCMLTSYLSLDTNDSTSW